jgi:hypothetical protein
MGICARLAQVNTEFNLPGWLRDALCWAVLSQVVSYEVHRVDCIACTACTCSTAVYTHMCIKHK